jgi:hypothetical protein
MKSLHIMICMIICIETRSRKPQCEAGLCSIQSDMQHIGL